MNNQYFAQLDENNTVLQVRVVTKDFLESNPDRYPGRWVETFYDTPGKTYAGPGLVYDEKTEDFIYPIIEAVE